MGWLHLLQWKYFSWCSITDKRLPWKLSKIVSLIQTNFQESNYFAIFTISLLCSFVFDSWLRWQPEDGIKQQRNFGWSCPAAVPAAFDQIRGIPDADQMILVFFVFFLGKERDRDKERQVLALLRVIKEDKRASAPMFIFVVFRDVRMKTNKFIIPDDRGVRELSSDL